MIPGNGSRFTAPLDAGQTPLDPDEAQGLIPGWIANRGDLDVAEEENIAEGIAWGERSRRQVLSQEFLRELHRRMFGRVWNWAGQYRSSERNIGVAPHAIATELKNLLDDVLAWQAHDTFTLDERAARLHHRLTWIHPFPNGNGRCSRVYTDLYLMRSKAPRFSWGALTGSAEQRAQYLQALRAADARDYAPLMAFARS